MNNPPYDSLRTKLVRPFVLLGFSVSALLSLLTFGLVAHIEEKTIDHVLEVEIENFRSRLQRNPMALPPSTHVLSGYFLPATEVPEIQPSPAGIERISRLQLGADDYSVMTTTIEGRPYALLYDRSNASSTLGQLALTLLFGTAGMTLLSFLVGNHLVGKVVHPIGKLLNDISDKVQRIRQRPDTAPRFAADDYPADEIGRLVQALDQLALRLHGFLERESCFAGDVSHELRTPVAVILGAAEVLVEYPELPDAVRTRLQTIQRQAARMAQLLEAMLLLAHEDGDHGDPACALIDVIDDAVTDARPSLFDRPVQIVLQIEDRPILPVERSLAYALVSNLLRNACAYTREGKISIRLNSQCVEITDTGIGISDDRFPLIFSRHIKEEESDGHGLGLSIVSRIAQRLNWKIEIESDAGKGTQVRLVFPEIKHI